MSTTPNRSAEGSTPAQPGGRRRLLRWLRWCAVVAGLAGILLLYMRDEGAERRALQTMPAPERQALFARTLKNLTQVCAEPADGMEDFCFDQARLAVEFPECDPACQALADRHGLHVRR
jgi:hypothetical protein